MYRFTLALLALAGSAFAQQIGQPRQPGSTAAAPASSIVRSVAITVPSSFVQTGGPITGVGTINIQESPGYRRLKQAAAPATCDVGDLWFDSDAPAGQNLFGCGATNVWTLMSGDGGGIPALEFATLPATCGAGEFAYVTDASFATGTWRLYTCTATDTWTQAGLQADGTGYLTVSCSNPNSCLVGPNVDVIPSKTAANVFTGANDFSGASKTSVFRVADMAPATCDASTREAYYNTTSNTLYFCNATDTWTAPSGGGAAARYFYNGGLTSAVTMTGSDVQVPGWDFALTSGLAAGKCLQINSGSGSTSSATMKVKIGTTFAGATTIATPWTGGGASILGFTLIYCNRPGVQNVQYAHYLSSPWYGTGSVNASVDGMHFIPSAQDLSATNLHLYVSLNQASGSITGQFLEVVEY